MMRIAVTTALLAAALATTGSTAQTGGKHPAKGPEIELGGLTPGKSISCIEPSNVSYIRGFENTIVYVAGRNKAWRNDTRGTCAGLKHDDIIVTRSLNGHYCAGDIVETRSRNGGMFTGACSLGEFVPYTKTQ